MKINALSVLDPNIAALTRLDSTLQKNMFSL